ncbi:MAG: hypothetical protein WCC60_08245, partial [Ilumatobacteraceae bacterium]
MPDPLRCLLPQPLIVERRDGWLTVDARTRVVVGTGMEDCAHTVSHLVADVQRAVGLHLSRGDVAGTGDIVLQLDP